MTSNPAPPFYPPPLPTKRTPYPHIQDLVARTNQLRPKDRASIRKWLEQAKAHWHQAQWHRSLNRLDSAYLDYLMAFTIVASMIPANQEYTTFRISDSPLYTEYTALIEAIRGQQPEFENIKTDIIKDNDASGVQSTGQMLANPQAQANGRSNGAASHNLQNEEKRAPEVRAKPEHLASKSVSQNSERDSMTAEDGLRARFERLAAGRNTGRPSSVPLNGLPASLVASGGAVRPQGPRQMPSKGLQIDVKNALPQMPPPVYSPSTSYGSPGGLPPPRSSRTVPDIVKPSLPPETEISLSVKALSDCLKAKISVLLLDVRSREDYEQGHIFSRSVVCVEPVMLREGMSADDLDDAFILSPRSQRDLFNARSEYELVVYYDGSTSSTSYLSSSSNTPQLKLLRILHLALQDYNFSKPLRRPPMLLIGGLNAWVDKFGPASLKDEESKPVVPVPSGGGLNRRSQQMIRAPTPLLLERRVIQPQTPPPYPTGSNNGGSKPMPMPAEPINIEEEEKWRDRLRKESDPIIPSMSQSSDEKKRRRATSVVANPAGNHARSIEEFFQRYPASPHAQESMVNKTPDSPTTLKRTNTIIDHPFHGFTDVRNPEFNPPTSPARPAPVAARKSYSGVSEPLAPANPPPIPIRPPKIPLSRNVTDTANFNIGTTGLKNLGNTCYMNSILQCMSGTTPLARYFLDGSYKQHINKDNPLSSRGILAEAFATVVRHLWSGEYNFISPVTFRDVSGRLNETFRSNCQQDALEFLEFLLDGLHEDLNPNSNRRKLNPLTEEEERHRERLPLQTVSEIEWQRYIHQNLSVAVNWLQGQLSSRLKCLTCGITSTTYNPFMYLSLPIPVKNSIFTLGDCIREFTKIEVLDGDDAWHCPSCKKPRKATKKLTITRLPHILIIHLKRFTNQGRWRDKLNTPINFPLAGLDLTEYVPEPLPLPPESQQQQSSERKQSAGSIPPFIYDLYATVNHYGTLHGGHYTAFVKNSYKGTWNSFDDSRATKVDESKVVSRNAYILFWVRRNVM